MKRACHQIDLPQVAFRGAHVNDVNDDMSRTKQDEVILQGVENLITFRLCN